MVIVNEEIHRARRSAAGIDVGYAPRPLRRAVGFPEFRAEILVVSREVQFAVYNRRALAKGRLSNSGFSRHGTDQHGSGGRSVRLVEGISS